MVGETTPVTLARVKLINPLDLGSQNVEAVREMVLHETRAFIAADDAHNLIAVKRNLHAINRHVRKAVEQPAGSGRPYTVRRRWWYPCWILEAPCR